MLLSELTISQVKSVMINMDSKLVKMSNGILLACNNLKSTPIKSRIIIGSVGMLSENIFWLALSCIESGVAKGRKYSNSLGL